MENQAMSLYKELEWRGFVHQTTIKDPSLIDEQKLTFYWGVDPSADSMTIGHLAIAMMVKRFISQGHKAVLLVGGATGLIGDPDGKKQERDLKTPEEIEANKKAIVAQYQTLFAGQDFEVVDNQDWFADMKYIDFLRDIGKNFSMSQLLDRDFVKTRVGEGGAGLSYAEFSYSLIQGYDFLHLSREKGVSLQLAGSDQWGNALSGVELIRKVDNKEAHVFTAPLIINKLTGEKFGKTEGGAVWLDPSKTSPYQFYQFWLNVDDDSAVTYLKIYTMLSQEDVDHIASENIRTPSDRLAQKTLAYEVTKLVHGEQRVEQVKKVTEVLFGTSNISDLDSSELDVLASEIPTVPFGLLSETLTNAHIVESRGEFRRLLDGGAFTVNGQRISEDQQIGEVSLVKKGKNNFILVR